MSLFERLPLGLLPGHFYAMMRLAAWAQRGHAVGRELLFIQTDPPEIRRRSHTSGRVISTASLPDSGQGSPAAPSVTDPMTEPLGLVVPKAPPPQIPDTRPARYGQMDHVQEPELGYHKVVFSPSEPRLVRPRPVVASTPARATSLSRPRSPTLPPPSLPPTQTVPPLPIEDSELAMPGASSSGKPMGVLPDSPIAVPALRPPAPMPLQQVSPLIQASLNARSEFKKASRQWRPKTFTVLSSSSGQFEPDKPHLLNGQEVSPQALSVHTKRRTTSATKLSSQLASQDLRTTTDPSPTGDASQVQTIAPKPSYFGRERGVLPTWLREQYEEGNVLYPPPDPADASVVNVFDALHNKAQQSLNGSERAAASINRNTPFFPPHERDRERAERATANGSGPEQYRRLNEETSSGRQPFVETIGERSGPKPGTGRFKTHLKGRRPELGMASQTWGTQFEAGTYAGFKSTPLARDQRMQLPHVSSKRSFHYRPIQEFQPMLTMPNDSEAGPHAEDDRFRGPEEGSRFDPFNVQGDRPRLSRTQSLTLRPSDEQRLSLHGDVPRARLKAEHRMNTSPALHSRRDAEEVPSRKSSRRMSKSKSVDMSKWLFTTAIMAESSAEPLAPKPKAELEPEQLEQERDVSLPGDHSDAGTMLDHEAVREAEPEDQATIKADSAVDAWSQDQPTETPPHEVDAEAIAETSVEVDAEANDDAAP